MAGPVAHPHPWAAHCGRKASALTAHVCINIAHTHAHTTDKVEERRGETFEMRKSTGSIFPHRRIDKAVPKREKASARYVRE